MDWNEATDTLLKTLISKPRLGVVSDVDGTLSHIVNDPTAAQVTPRCREFLSVMQPHLTLLSFVSGRGAADIHNRVGIPGAVYVGNHGMERWQNGGPEIAEQIAVYRPQLDAFKVAIQPYLHEGMIVEDKVATISIHYRRTADPAQAAAAFRSPLADVVEANGLHWYEGKMIFEVRPPVEVNKGSAFRSLIDEYQLDGAIYLGDDITDVDALKVAQALRKDGACYALALGVLHDDTPEPVRAYSDLLASDVTGVELFLGWLSNALSASST